VWVEADRHETTVGPENPGALSEDDLVMAKVVQRVDAEHAIEGRPSISPHCSSFPP
jgi:hypothetical protein